MNALYRKTTMKRVDFYYFLTLSLIFIALFGVPKLHRQMPQAVPVKQMRKEQLASHFLTLKDEDGKDASICTGTAIGPHAIMTAEHCMKDGDIKEMTIDQSTEVHEILSAAVDGRDHVILLLDGSPFRNIEKVNGAHSKVGDTVTMFGVGGEEYPPVPKYGKVIDCEDPSDVDFDSGVQCSTLPVIAGDSGSAIYNTKGEIVAIATYRADYGEAGFELEFTQGIIDAAASFSNKVAQK